LGQLLENYTQKKCYFNILYFFVGVATKKIEKYQAQKIPSSWQHLVNCH